MTREEDRYWTQKALEKEEMPTIAAVVDNAILEAVALKNPFGDAEALSDLYDGIPKSMSREEYVEFVKRNLEGYNKLLLGRLKDNLEVR